MNHGTRVHHKVMMIQGVYQVVYDLEENKTFFMEQGKILKSKRGEGSIPSGNIDNWEGKFSWENVALGMLRNMGPRASSLVSSSMEESEEKNVTGRFLPKEYDTVSIGDHDDFSAQLAFLGFHSSLSLMQEGLKAGQGDSKDFLAQWAHNREAVAASMAMAIGRHEADVVLLSEDAVAVYALGTMTRESIHTRIFGVWAPLLLLHLGGPDTVTAYSTVDNELWKRHLLNMVYQVSVAIY
ncbi:hypothetical protein KI387_025824, partial [Taxus chinensis]